MSLASEVENRGRLTVMLHVAWLEIAIGELIVLLHDGLLVVETEGLITVLLHGGLPVMEIGGLIIVQLHDGLLEVEIGGVLIVLLKGGLLEVETAVGLITDPLHGGFSS